MRAVTIREPGGPDVLGWDEVPDPGCGPGTPQYEWLEADLADDADTGCTLAIQHEPVFDWRPWQKWVDPDSDNPNGGSEVEHLRDLWRLMDREGVDVLLVGHNHLYHRCPRA